jgi:hypothetical protein
MVKRKFDRAKWFPYELMVKRHKPSGVLFDTSTGRSCCLGLELLARGVISDNLIGKTMPDEINPKDSPGFMVNDGIDLDRGSSLFSKEAAKINDSNDSVTYPTIEKKEEAIIELFATVDIEVEFFGELGDVEDLRLN